MTTAFQRSAFQDNAFQIDALTAEVRWPGTTVGHKHKKKEQGPDIGLVRELQRQRDEHAAKLAAEAKHAKDLEDQRVAEKAELERAEAAAGRELTAAERYKLYEMFKPAPLQMPVASPPPITIREPELRPITAEEELVILMLLAN